MASDETNPRRTRRRASPEAIEDNAVEEQQAPALNIPTNTRPEAHVDKISNDPIAVVDPFGHVFPYGTATIDRFYRMMANCTYIWTQEELRKVMQHNEKMILKRAFDRIAMGDALPARPNEGLDGGEVRAAVFNPNMLQGA